MVLQTEPQFPGTMQPHEANTLSAKRQAKTTALIWERETPRAIGFDQLESRVGLA